MLCGYRASSRDRLGAPSLYTWALLYREGRESREFGIKCVLDAGTWWQDDLLDDTWRFVWLHTEYAGSGEVYLFAFVFSPGELQWHIWYSRCQSIVRPAVRWVFFRSIERKLEIVDDTSIVYVLIHIILRVSRVHLDVEIMITSVKRSVNV